MSETELLAHYVERGGEPWNVSLEAAWLDYELRAWVRPRHDGYMAFQQAASDRILSGMTSGHRPAQIIADLNRLFREGSPAQVSGAAGGGA